MINTPKFPAPLQGLLARRPSRVSASDMPFVSVVVPTHNRAPILREALEALWKQTYPVDRYEVIIIDDGSKDETPEVIDEVVRQAPCRVVTQRTTGVGAAAARNLGTRLATGSIVAHTDDDCRVPPGWLEAGVRAFSEEDVAIVFGPIYAKPEQRINFFSWVMEFSEPTGAYPTSNIFYRKAPVQEEGGFDESFGKNLLGRPVWGWDNDLAYRILRKGYLARFHKDAYAYTHVFRLSPWQWLAAGWRHSMIPSTVRATPELRHILLKRGLFADHVSWSYELGLLGTVAALATGRRSWLLAWLPWLRYAAGYARHDWSPPTRWPALSVKTAFSFALHTIRFTALLYGSLRARRLVL